MVLSFADHEGDPVAVDSQAIVGLSVGSINGPRAAGAELRVTLIWAAGIAQPFMVAASFETVMGAWSEARLVEAGARDAAQRSTHPYPAAIGWQQQYPGGVG